MYEFPCFNLAFKRLHSCFRRFSSSSAMKTDLLSKYKLPEIANPKDSSHKLTFFFLHGLGDQGDGWCYELSQQMPSFVRCVCPNANAMPVTMNCGMTMPAWYDIKSLDEQDCEDHANIQHSSDYLTELCKKEIESGVPSENIIIGGFSQGGVVALYNFLTTDIKLGGAIILSAYLPLAEEFAKSKILNKTNKTTPLMLCHGLADTLVLPEYFYATQKVLNSIDYAPFVKEYKQMGHSSEVQELKDINTFILDYIPGTDEKSIKS